MRNYDTSRNISLITRITLYKNLVYKNVEAQILEKNKNILRT